VTWDADLLPPPPPLPVIKAPGDPADLGQRLEAMIAELQETIRQSKESEARYERQRRRWSEPVRTPDVTVRTEPALPLPLHLTLSAEPVSAWAKPDFHSWPVLGRSALDAGAREAQLTPTADVPGEPAEYALIVNDSLVFKTCLPETTPR
jgi:hypothetical protein